MIFLILLPFKRTQRYFNGKEILDKLHKCIPSKLCFLYSTDPLGFCENVIRKLK